MCAKAMIAVGILCVLSPVDAIGTEFTPDEQLIQGCQALDIDLVVSAMRKGAKVNATIGSVKRVREALPEEAARLVGSDSWTPLLALCHALPRHDREQMPKELAKKYSNDQVAILYILLANSCDTNAPDRFGATPLYVACEHRSTGMVKILLKYGANPNTKTRVYIDGPGDSTPLHCAYDDREMVEALIAHGADPTSRDTRGDSVLTMIHANRDVPFKVERDSDNQWRVLDRTSE